MGEMVCIQRFAWLRCMPLVFHVKKMSFLFRWARIIKNQKVERWGWFCELTVDQQIDSNLF